ncbi:hypothetical protein CLIB1423_07S01860 [[Candida] railenensis]|uniref:Uncharacterized protein n=1 Tax=[Candida] railenensis TaxID=45579 RepID=A0A9P0VY12_9ASCO|nr:hypothetical protein CLIB1423_07S01860 [[Candida] railenensis]
MGVFGDYNHTVGCCVNAFEFGVFGSGVFGLGLLGGYLSSAFFGKLFRLHEFIPFFVHLSSCTTGEKELNTVFHQCPTYDPSVRYFQSLGSLALDTTRINNSFSLSSPPIFSGCITQGYVIDISCSLSMI